MTTVYEDSSMALLCGTRTYRLKKAKVTPEFMCSPYSVGLGQIPNGCTIEVEFDPDAVEEAVHFLRPHTHCLVQLCDGSTIGGQLTKLDAAGLLGQNISVHATITTKSRPPPTPWQQAVDEMAAIAEGTANARTATDRSHGPVRQR